MPWNEEKWRQTDFHTHMRRTICNTIKIFIRIHLAECFLIHALNYWQYILFISIAGWTQQSYMDTVVTRWLFSTHTRTHVIVSMVLLFLHLWLLNVWLNCIPRTVFSSHSSFICPHETPKQKCVCIGLTGILFVFLFSLLLLFASLGMRAIESVWERAREKERTSLREAHMNEISWKDVDVKSGGSAITALATTIYRC